MTIPSESAIWLMGFLGMVGLFINMAGQGDIAEYKETGNAVSILIDCFASLTSAPICLYFKKLYGDNTPARTKKYVKYYIAILMIVGIATTRRAIIFTSIVTIALIYVFLIIYNNKNIFSLKYVGIVCFIGYLATGPLADLAAAMIINRQLVHSTNAMDTFTKVWDLFLDKEALHEAYQLAMAVTDNMGENDAGWSEYYVDNIFLDRFCNLRTIDATLYNAQKWGFDSEEGKEYYKNYWINELPSPITNALGFKKDFLGTATDHMVVDNFGDRYSLFGFKVGGETGIGLWMFGYWYYLIALFTYFGIFYFLCSFVNTNGIYLLIPVPILMNFMQYWMFFLNANGVFSSMGYVFGRSNLNKILLYCILVFIFRKLSLAKK